MRWYPSPAIAASWDPEWTQFKTIPDCTGLKLGVAMKHKSEEMTNPTSPSVGTKIVNVVSKSEIINKLLSKKNKTTSDNKALNSTQPIK